MISIYLFTKKGQFQKKLFTLFYYNIFFLNFNLAIKIIFI